MGRTPSRPLPKTLPLQVPFPLRKRVVLGVPERGGLRKRVVDMEKKGKMLRKKR